LLTIVGNSFRPVIKIMMRVQAIVQPSGKERGGRRTVVIQT